MSGQSYLDEIYNSLSKHLDYYWTACYLTPGQPTPLRQVNVNTTWKPLLMFTKKNDKYKGKIFGDVFKSDGNDKDFHKWGQSESGMFDIVSKICLSGQSVLDPFCGAGTTGIAAIKYGCFFDGLELDIENVNISKARLNDQTTI
jgi:site-specific DNA-methyltransferase (adenine-specific)